MTEPTSTDQMRDRTTRPIIIPLGAFAIIAALTIGISRILLGVPPMVAVAVATMTALSILIVCAVIALREKLAASDFVLLLGAAVVPIVMGGAVALGIIDVERKPHHPGPPEAVRISADSLAFDRERLPVPAAHPFTLEFHNAEAVPHNVAIFAGDSASAPVIFRGEIFSGPATMNYQVPALEPGEYYFHCDVHPNMEGLIVAEESAAEPHREGGQTAQIAAMNIQFDRGSLEFVAGQAISLSFNNQEAVPHNLAIFRGAVAEGDVVFRGEIFPGPKTVVYRIPPLEPGEYEFHCDVHPSMRGTITVM